MLSNREMFARFDRVELKQLETDKKPEEVFDYISTTKEVKRKIFSTVRYMMILVLW